MHIDRGTIKCAEPKQFPCGSNLNQPTGLVNLISDEILAKMTIRNRYFLRYFLESTDEGRSF